jgi:hypothetical protein
MWKPLTGEPCAGKPHARFGGRGGRCPFLPLFYLKLYDLPKAAPEEVINTYKSKIADYKKNIEQYEQEKIEIQEKAKKLETVRDESQLHSQAFGMAIIFLQIAILLSSIAALLKKKMLWYGGLAAGVIGLFYFLNGFMIFI